MRTVCLYEIMELGFVEEVEDPEELTSLYYPSKVGGKPAWLDQSRIPSRDTLTCKKCGETMVHLLQIQSSSLPADETEHHRTIFIFMCADPKCHSPGSSDSFVVLRCELDEKPRMSSVDKKSVERFTDIQSSCDKKVKNDEDKEAGSLRESSVCSSQLNGELSSGCNESMAEKSPQAAALVHSLCYVCGIAGPMKCGRCKMVHYCSRGHQVHDWKAGHKQVCAKLAAGDQPASSLDYDPSVGVALPELEIVTELEPLECIEEKAERSEEERMKDYHQYLEESRGGGRKAVASVEELERAAATSQKKDKVFRAFKKRISLEPTQVLRYKRNGDPLFVSGERIPRREDIPVCSCGAERTFELQVMPQLLYYLRVDHGPSGTTRDSHTSLRDDHTSSSGIDWGTLLVYTCNSDLCTLGPGYHQEFLWKQNIC